MSADEEGYTLLTIARPTYLDEPLDAVASSLPGKIAIAVMAALLVALAAHVSIPLPFSPVPLSLQPFAVLLVGMLLGPAVGFGAMLLYLGEGLAGMPVFTPFGPGGIAQVLGPTGGYLLAYPFAAPMAGWLARSLPTANGFVRGLVAAACGVVIIFLFGATWLATLLHADVNTTLRMAVLPYLPGEIVKVVAAALVYRAMQQSGRRS